MTDGRVDIHNLKSRPIPQTFKPSKVDGAFMPTMTEKENGVYKRVVFEYR